MRSTSTLATALTFALTAALLLATPVLAGGNEPRVDCANMSGSTYEMNVCSERDFDAADAKLNAVWKKVLAHVEENGGDKPWDAKSWEAAIRAAQRAWIAFRDADCKDAVPMEWSGGTGTTSAVLSCMAEKTEARTKELSIRFGLE